MTVWALYKIFLRSLLAFFLLLPTVLPSSCPSAYSHFNIKILNLNATCNSFSLLVEGDWAFEHKHFEESFLVYSRTLPLYGLSPHLKASLYVKRILASLHLKSLETSSSERSSFFAATLQAVALGDALNCLKLRPDWWKCYYFLGRLQHLLENYPAAYKAYNQALGLNPTEKSIKIARELLKSEAGYQIDPDGGFAKKMTGKYIDFQLKEATKLLQFRHTKISTVLDTYKKISQNSNPKIASLGQVLIGNLYSKGTEGLEINYKIAATWYKLAIEFGQNPEASFRLSLLYLIPNSGLQASIEFALEGMQSLADEQPIDEWDEESFEVDWIDGEKKELREEKTKWIAIAQRFLGTCWMDGVFTQNNFTKAAQLFKKSMENGNPDAAHDLAELFLEGKGVEKNLEKAKEYFKVAAYGGVSKSNFFLAQICLKELNVDESEEWFTAAIDEQDSNALSRQKEFEKLLVDTRFKLREIGLQNLALVSSDVSKSIPENLQKKFDLALMKYWSVESKIKKMARLDGHLYAFSIVKSMKNLKEARKLFHLSESDLKDLPQDELDFKILAELADSLRINIELFYLTWEELQKVQQILDKVFNKKVDLKVDLDGRIVKSYLMMNLDEDPNEVIEFLNMSKLKYPQEEFFHLWHAKRLTMGLEFQESFQVSGTSMLTFEHNPDIIFHHLQLLRIFKGGFEDEVENVDIETLTHIKGAFLKFLEIAPIDHEGVPAINYAIAEMAMRIEKFESLQTKKNLKSLPKEFIEDHEKYSKKLKRIVKEHLESGRKAENLLIPPLLPYRHEATLKIKLMDYLEGGKYGEMSEEN